ncbi:MAG: hypothetical protein DWQ36_15060 [Acidobacteria bacterium]|nr:MAG: hypothetical protein DWQ30_00160 [Acidobacteriota bacterium]REK06211.1 MAG: hypothetical protein DWQ36_15060 [Acidobacteriota bacterium]
MPRSQIVASITLFLAALVLPAATPLDAQTDPCRSWKDEIREGRKYTSRLTWHKVDVTFDGEILGSERHEKEIREGEVVRFGDIECEKNTIDLEIISTARDVKSKLRLLLAKAERQRGDAAALDQLLEVVLERGPAPGEGR